MSVNAAAGELRSLVGVENLGSAFAQRVFECVEAERRGRLVHPGLTRGPRQVGQRLAPRRARFERAQGEVSGVYGCVMMQDAVGEGWQASHRALAGKPE